MNHPKLKHPRICRLLTYVVVVGAGLLPIILVVNLPVHDAVKLIVVFASLIGLLIYLVRNFIVLMSMDAALASLSCYRTARRQYTLPNSRTADTIRKSILRYGTECEPAAIKPAPSSLRYKFGYPLTVYSRGIEKVIAAYEVDLLTRELYRDIFSSAKTNSMSLIGRKKALFLDKQQKNQPLHRITVVLILAHRVDPAMVGNMYELLCKQCGNEEEDCVLPCVVDLGSRTCVFNCLRIPYIGFSYAVKNRGIRIIKNRVFGGTLPLTDAYTLPTITDADPEASLWDFWKELHYQMIGAERKTKRKFEAMAEREIQMVGEILYLKWDQRGICQTVVMDSQSMAVKVESVTDWSYPRFQPIGKKTIPRVEEQIKDYFIRQGYTVEFHDIDELL